MYDSSMEDRRLAALVDWLQRDLSLDISQLSPASSDASFRRYFRVVHAGGVQIAMDAPPEKENCAAFIRIAGLMRDAGIHVPAVYRSDTRQGFLLLEDLGSENLLDRLTPATADALYAKALDSLFELQRNVDTTTCQLPEYDAAFIERELGIFYEWFLQKLVGLELPQPLAAQLNRTLVESALAQPRVCVHRDYHSRNLMLPANGGLGVIDFQDAVVGPISYDPVSLLRDCYIAWPEHRVDEWVQAYHARLCESRLLDADYPQFRRWFDLMGLQRHLKAIGIFARLHLRDGKPNYLADIPRTFAYVESVCARYPELGQFRQFLQDSLKPAYPPIR
ncbi:aminoglycoside phosphotransferase family protein [Methylomonas koyamae]|uniref:aminoglycoside phosphotransferase family protein n=1 Tax=Methylomonas koyamae TaxID=702114 RepID=UPI002873EF51|nr:phosphotransferase [Methylomonas koyamae]WNB74634.1 phosphotransferase [Methylomonas koyamae]